MPPSLESSFPRFSDTIPTLEFGVPWKLGDEGPLATSDCCISHNQSA